MLVRELRINDRMLHQCEFCNMGYAEIENAEKCEDYCGTHEVCSADITRRAIYKPAVKFMPE